MKNLLANVSILVAICFCIPVSGACAQTAKIEAGDKEAINTGWEYDETTTQVVPSEVAGRNVIQLTGDNPRATQFMPTLPAKPYVLQARVILPQDSTVMPRAEWNRDALRVVWKQEVESGDDPPLEVMSLSRGRARDAYTYAAEYRRGRSSKSATFVPAYTMQDISPLMNEDERLILEQRADYLTPAHKRVHIMRIEVRDDSVTLYASGRLAVQHDAIEGDMYLQLTGKAQLVDAIVRPLEKFADRFHVIPLDDFLNDQGPAGNPLLKPAPGSIMDIHGIPFITPMSTSDGDNLDLEPSVYLNRMGNHRKGDSRESVYQPEHMDVTQFRMRVPKKTYRRAWVIAASDEDDHNIPQFTLRFYRPRTAWAVDSVAAVPTYSAQASVGDAERIELADGKSLWLIPVDIDTAALAVEQFYCIELTKTIYPYRSWPDPAYYGSYPGGLPSAVHIYGLTLEEAPIHARATGAKNGNLYLAEEEPTWHVHLTNLQNAAQDVTIKLKVTGPYREESILSKTMNLPADGESHEIVFNPATPVFGLYTVNTTITSGDFTQSREGKFLRLSPNNAKANKDNSPWGLWCWNGGHDTNPDADDNMRLLSALGAINNYTLQERTRVDRETVYISLYDKRMKYGIGAMHHRLVPRRLPAWAYEDPHDPEKFEAYAEEKGLEAKELSEKHPDLQFVNYFAENHISLRVTHGMSPWAMGQPYFEYDEKEASRIRAHWLTAMAATKGVRKHAPHLKILFGHGAGNFAQPFFRLDEWDNNLFDGFGLDLPQFERMPERQPRATEPNLLWFMHNDMKKKGLLGKEMVHLESYFPSSGPMALTFDEQARSVPRTAVLSMSLGTTRFMRTWELHTSGDGWGSSHYGSCGLIDRAPEFNPKEAAAAFATMTRTLDMAKFDGYIDVGSRSSFCLRFKDTDRLVYPVWTIRGTRPLTLTLQGNATIERVDFHGNTFDVPITNGSATVQLNPHIQWLVVRNGEIASASVGEPAYETKPIANSKLLATFDDGWSYDATEFERYQNNHWDMPREPGKMQHAFVTSDERSGKVLQVKLAEPSEDKPMAGHYGQYIPAKPIAIPGRAETLGMYVNGKSAWNRFIFEIEDAKGEKWISCGTRDAWNCDDIHSWSSINHDGWRYMRFPLPANAPGDNYREKDSVWWGSDAEGIVDLPIKLTKIMIEMRPKMIYVNDMRAIEDLTIALDDLHAEYASKNDMTDAPVRLQLAAADVLTSGKASPLPNPFAELKQSGKGTSPKIANVYPPEQHNAGTQLFVEVEPIDGAAEYRGYVSAYPDGRGAKALGVSATSKNRYARYVTKPNQVYYYGLQAARPMYLFITAVDAEGNESKPSAIRPVVLKDEFPFK